MTTTLTDAERETLRQIARSATPGQWTAHEGDLEGKPASEYARTLFANREEDGTTTARLFLTMADNDIDPERGDRVVPALTGDGPRSEANAVHIAAFSPATALALLDDLDLLAARLASVEALADEFTRWADGVDATNHTSAEVGRWVVRRLRAALAAPAAPEPPTSPGSWPFRNPPPDPAAPTHEEDHR